MERKSIDRTQLQRVLLAIVLVALIAALISECAKGDECPPGTQFPNGKCLGSLRSPPPVCPESGCE
jgi:hypothetical protein